jgi:hypothetical protein
MCKMDREIGTRPPMSDDKQVVFYVSGFLTVRSFYVPTLSLPG